MFELAVFLGEVLAETVSATSVAWAVLLGQSVVSFGSGQGALGRKMERSGSWGLATYRENARTY